jgi:hypothetical protein
MAKSDAVKDCVKAFMLEQGFHQEGSGRFKPWVRELDDVVWFVWLQVNKYGRRYYVNLGINFKSIPEDERLPNPWHVTTRLENEVQHDTWSRHDEVLALMDLRKEMPDEERKARIRELLEQFAMPFLRSCDSIEHAKAAHSKRRYLFSDKVRLAIYGTTSLS